MSSLVSESNRKKPCGHNVAQIRSLVSACALFFTHCGGCTLLGALSKLGMFQLTERLWSCVRSALALEEPAWHPGTASTKDMNAAQAETRLRNPSLYI